MVQSLERQGYTVLLARNDWEYIYHIHRQIPDLVKVIIADPKGDGRHYEDWLKSEERPDGVPAWKVSWRSVEGALRGRNIGMLGCCGKRMPEQVGRRSWIPRQAVCNRCCPILILDDI
jgi:DNA-binding response OmpR family regulator